MRHGLSRCLDLLDRHDLTATFFVLGWTAERFPELVRNIAQRGHEVACHSYAHPEVFKLTREAFREDCDRALTALDRAGVDQVHGYRAPSFSITPDVHDYLDILQACGFAYDCSIFPIHHPRYGQPTSPRKPFRLGDDPGALVVVPMPTWRFLGVNVPYSGGGYLRLLPWPAFKLLRRLGLGAGCALYRLPASLGTGRLQARPSACPRPTACGARAARTPCRPSWSGSCPMGNSRPWGSTSSA